MTWPVPAAMQAGHLDAIANVEPAVRDASGLKPADAYTNEFVKAVLVKF